MSQPMDERVDTLLEDINTLCALVDANTAIGESYLIGRGGITYLGLVTVLLEDTNVLGVRSGNDPVLGGPTRIYTRGVRPVADVAAAVSRQWTAWTEDALDEDELGRIVRKHLRQLRAI